MATKYTQTAQTGSRGVAFVQSVSSEAGGIFRKFDEADDLGIDGAIEFIDENKEPTGDIALVQVKSGASYVRSDNDTYFVQGDQDHFETWSRYALPVIGVVHNPEKGDARWVDISEHLRQHPESIGIGPYNINATRPFSADHFQDIYAQIAQNRIQATLVETTPNAFIRGWASGDAKATRVLLSPIAKEYPSFYEWLARKWRSGSVSKKVFEFNGTIAAYSMWQKKDDRCVKLQTFIVAPPFRRTAVGQHLLFHEIRTWSDDSGIDRVHVTISSGNTDLTNLVRFFRRFGFLVEGVASRRYNRDTSGTELVLVKHLLRDKVSTPNEWQALAEKIGREIWGINTGQMCQTRFGIAERSSLVPVSFPKISLDCDLSDRTSQSRISLRDSNGIEIREMGDEALMREFYPLRLHLLRKRYVLIPIYPKWCEAMLSNTIRIFRSKPRLNLRLDNVYYCYPKVTNLSSGDFVIFYETGRGQGRRAAIGSAVVKNVDIDSPDALYDKYSDLGVYSLDEIRRHVRQAKSMAIHFDLFEPFKKRLSTVSLETGGFVT